MKDKETLITIKKAISASLELRSKRELIEQFIKTINNETKIYKGWQEFAAQNKAKDLKKIIAEENLKKLETKKFIENAFRDGQIQEAGQAFTDILPPLPMFLKDNAYSQKKLAVLEKLRAFFAKYFGI
jgi:type I restriction enzyme R subunit